MNKKTKLIFAGTLLIGLIGLVLAFWAAGVFVADDEDEININVGIPDYVDTIINLTGNDENNLVPIGTLANSPAGSVEFVVIPLNLLWTEPDNNHAEGLKGLFTIEPTVTIVHNVSLVNETYLESAIELVNIYFVKGDEINLSSISSALSLVEGSNPNTYINTLNNFDADVSTGSFELELTIEIPAVVYLVAFIGIPNINTFSYIHEAEIYINLKTFANDGQTYPVPIIPKATPGFRQISAGYNHVLAIDHEGYVWGWGSNANGQFGNNDGGFILKPTKIAGLENVKVIAVSAGWYHSLAIDIDGNIWGWGQNGDGRLGYGEATADKMPPTMFVPEKEFVSIFAGQTSSFAIDIDGDIWGWGDNASSQLGIVILNKQYTERPALITGAIEVGFDQITSAQTHTLALDKDGNIWSWGQCSYGSLGDGIIQAMHKIDLPKVITDENNTLFKSVETSANVSFAIDRSGNLWSWGNNASYQLGDGLTANKSKPTPIPKTDAMIGVEFVRIVVGAGYFVLALDTNGNLWCWGNDTYGNFGDGETSTWPRPQIDKAAANFNILDITIAYYATIILDSEYQIWAAGHNGYGQFGNGTTNNSSIFVPQEMKWD